MMSARLICMSVLAAGAAAAASAETPVQSTTDTALRFVYDAEAAASEAGAQETYRKLASAAALACRHEAPSALRFTDASCKAEVMASAVERINAPLMTQMFRASPEYARLQQDAPAQVAAR
jgi:UrcA family protein